MIDQNVVDGIRKFVRLTALAHDERQVKWVRHEGDLIEALETVRDSFNETRRVIGKQLYQCEPVFDPCEDVKKMLEECLFTGKERRDVALQRKRNLCMYHLVVEPVIDMFKDHDHRHIIAIIDSRIAEVIDYINNHDIESHYDDALITRVQVGALIAEREERRKLQKAKRKPRQKKLATHGSRSTDFRFPDVHHRTPDLLLEDEEILTISLVEHNEPISEQEDPPSA